MALEHVHRHRQREEPDPHRGLAKAHHRDHRREHEHDERHRHRQHDHDSPLQQAQDRGALRPCPSLLPGLRTFVRTRGTPLYIPVLEQGGTAPCLSPDIAASGPLMPYSLFVLPGVLDDLAVVRELPGRRSVTSPRSLVTSRIVATTASARPAGAGFDLAVQGHPVLPVRLVDHQPRARDLGMALSTAATCAGCTNMPFTLVAWSARPIQPPMRTFVRPHGSGRRAPRRDRRSRTGSADSRG